MTTQADPLATALIAFDAAAGANGATLDSRDRLAYSTGRLLAVEDFEAEQRYHRGRLARAMAALNGSGTVAGLRAVYQAAPAANPDDEQVRLQPGIALDRVGRLIEVPWTVCLRLGVWYRQQPVDMLRGALKGAPFNGVVADLFLHFVVCPRGKTPAFASGPFDALDASQPSRLRDTGEARLVLRQENAADLANLVPHDNWPDFTGLATPAARRAALQEAIFNAWPTEAATSLTSPEPPLEYPPNQDTTSVFLARVVIPAVAGATANDPPVRQAAPVTIDNSLRLFVYRARAVAHGAGL